MWVIYTVESEADALVSRILGGSQTYAKKHYSEDKWAVRINNGGEADLTQAEKDSQVSLTADWFPPEPE